MSDHAAEIAAMRERLADAEEAWLWHEAHGDLRARYGHHMAQMLYRLPHDGQTQDMQASIERMVADLRALVDQIAAVEALVAAAEYREATSLARTFEGGSFGAWVDADALRAAITSPPGEVS